MVTPGFNSGWSEVTGMSSNTDDSDPEDDLVSFDGKGEYSHPNLSGIILLDLLQEVSQFR